MLHNPEGLFSFYQKTKTVYLYFYFKIKLSQYRETISGKIQRGTEEHTIKKKRRVVMKKFLFNMLKYGLVYLLLFVLIWWGMRAYDSWHTPLQPWHTYVPEELSAEELDKADLNRYLEVEEQLFEKVRTQVTDKLTADEKELSNRFYSGAPIYPPHFKENWNRSYVIHPKGKIKGAVILLHGLTDAPYSLRHIAHRYAQNGYTALGLRLPGHGTVPAGLTDATWEDWMAATRLAVRSAREFASKGKPIHIVGFSNGGALAMKYALDALEDKTLPQVDRVMLISPMVGITRFARFAGIAAVPAHFPAFERSAWLSVLPEFNPFKYNSFPVNGAVQSWRLTRVLQSQIRKMGRTDYLKELPPVVTFQSTIDHTVSTPAIVYGLYAHLPSNESELILFDVNQVSLFSPLMRSVSRSVVENILPPSPRLYSVAVIGNRTQNDVETALFTTPAGATQTRSKDLGIRYPRDIFSLSHVSIPFPMDDELYGMTPKPWSYKMFGVNLGNIAVRGEQGALMVNLDSLFRTTSNPFFGLLLEKVDQAIADPAPLRRLDKNTIQKPELIDDGFWKKEEQKFMQEAEQYEGEVTP